MERVPLPVEEMISFEILAKGGVPQIRLNVRNNGRRAVTNSTWRWLIAGERTFDR